jgi:hypothetical protein
MTNAPQQPEVETVEMTEKEFLGAFAGGLVRSADQFLAANPNCPAVPCRA